VIRVHSLFGSSSLQQDLQGGEPRKTKSRRTIPLAMLRTVPRKWRTPMSDQALYGPRDDRPVTQASTDVTTRGIASMRDLRLDLFRGIALFLIFIDHIPGNVLSQFTLQSV